MATFHFIASSRAASEFVKLLLAAGADACFRNTDGRTALGEALLQQSKTAETYFPVQTIGLKKLEQAIEILRSKSRKKS